MSFKFFPSNKPKVSQILIQTKKHNQNTQSTLNSNDQKLKGITEQERSVLQINTLKANETHQQSQNMKKLVNNHAKHSSLDLEPFLIKSNSKIIRFSKIQSARSKKTIHFDLNNQLKGIECKEQNLWNTQRQKNGPEEKLLDLLLLNTMELKKKFSIKNDETTVQKQRSKISINVNIKGLPSDFF